MQVWSEGCMQWARCAMLYFWTVLWDDCSLQTVSVACEVKELVKARRKPSKKSTTASQSPGQDACITSKDSRLWLNSQWVWQSSAGLSNMHAVFRATSDVLDSILSAHVLFLDRRCRIEGGKKLHLRFRCEKLPLQVTIDTISDKGWSYRHLALLDH
jgi:hypothetical protein